MVMHLARDSFCSYKVLSTELSPADTVRRCEVKIRVISNWQHGANRTWMAKSGNIHDCNKQTTYVPIGPGSVETSVRPMRTYTHPYFIVKSLRTRGDDVNTDAMTT